MDTGSSSEPVLAIQSVVRAKGSGAMPVWLRDRETDGRQQHGRGVEAQHDRADHGQRGERQPQQDHPVPGPAGERVGGDVEDAGQLGDLGGHGDREQEDRDRQHLGQDGVQGLAHGDDGWRAAVVTGSGTGPNCWLQVQPAQSTSSRRRSSRADRTSRRPGRRQVDHLVGIEEPVVEEAVGAVGAVEVALGAHPAVRPAVAERAAGLDERRVAEGLVLAAQRRGQGRAVDLPLRARRRSAPRRWRAGRRA